MTDKETLIAMLDRARIKFYVRGDCIETGNIKFTFRNGDNLDGVYDYLQD